MNSSKKKEKKVLALGLKDRKKVPKINFFTIFMRENNQGVEKTLFHTFLFSKSNADCHSTQKKDSVTLQMMHASRFRSSSEMDFSLRFNVR